MREVVSNGKICVLNTDPDVSNSYCLIYCKNYDTQKIYSKCQERTIWFYNEVMQPKEADGMAII